MAFSISNKPFEAVAYNTNRSMVSSASEIKMKDSKAAKALEARRKEDSWQDEAWDYFDYVGEIKASANYIANVLSKVSIYPAYVKDAGEIPINVSEVEEIADDLKETIMSLVFKLQKNGRGASDFLRNAALNYFVAGECYLVRQADPDDAFNSGERDIWSIRSVNEVVAVQKSGKATLYIKPRRTSKPEEYILIKAAYRLWRNHPRYSDEADSSVRGILELGDELLLIARSSKSAAKSRLNAGILAIPDSIADAASSDAELTDEDGYSDEQEASFEEKLMDSIISPIDDETSASSVTPLIVRVPGDDISKINHIKLDNNFDEQLNLRHERVLDRILTSLDIPKDVARGLSDLKYSNGLIVEESLYKSHIEPMILMIMDALTATYLKPALRAMDMPEDIIDRVVLWYNPSAITAKPSKAEAVDRGYELGVVSAAYWRTAYDIPETAAPSELDVAYRIAKERGMPSQILTDTVLSLFIPKEVADQVRQASQAQSDPNSQATLNEALSPGANEGAPPSDPGAEPTGDTPADGEEPPTTLLEP